MTVLSLIASSDALARALRGGFRITAEVTTIVGDLGPVANLLVKVPKAAPVAQRFHCVRLLASHSSSKLVEAEFKAAGEALIKAAKGTDSATLKAIREEVESTAMLIAFRRVAGEVTVPAAGKLRKLTKADVTLFREFSQRLLMTDEPGIELLQQTWRQVVNGIGADNAVDWALVLSEARKAAKGMPEDFLQFGPGWRRALDQAAGGRINNVQGAIFEPYARALLKRIGEIEEMLRAARRTAGNNGVGWGVQHVNGELKLAYVNASQIEKVARGEGADLLKSLKFEQFADDGVLAIGPPMKGGLREAEASALMEFKAEGGPSELGDKLVSFLRRQKGGQGKQAVLIRYTDAEGKEVTAILRPPRSGQKTTYYAVGTENTRIPEATGLVDAGISQRQVVADVTRDYLRLIAEDLIAVAASLRSEF
ncbi:MAG: hypothetical protein ACKO1H_11280 [Tabrizicola sp.]